MNKEFLLFDMDGVLIDSFLVWWQSLNLALKEQKDKEISKDKFEQEYWGDTLQENLKKLNINKNKQQFCQTFFEKYIEDINIFDQTKNTLDQLSNYKKALITNTPRSCTKKILERFDLKKYFDVYITSDQIKNGKPSPDMIYKACEKLSVDPKYTIIVGDTENDIKKKKKANCKTVGIKIKADYTIENISELTNIIK